MPDTQLPPIMLSESTEAELKYLMETGKYVSETDAIAAAIEALAAQERQFDDFLRREVLPAYEEAQAHPERLIPAEEVFDRILAKHDAREAAKK